ncbi:MAG: HPr family phosphocarrier protein [Alphaproteobacteria bacterium]|nr:HPr family phosphocarrier protein [Alphaproteobacteria bacterium]
MTNNFLTQVLQIQNKKGLHARAASCFVKLAEQFDAEVFVEKDGQRVCGTSIMGLMMLAAAKGCDVKLIVSGQEAQQAMTALAELIDNKFNEEE